jgi:hypothetical protein
MSNAHTMIATSSVAGPPAYLPWLPAATTKENTIVRATVRRMTCLVLMLMVAIHIG